MSGPETKTRRWKRVEYDRLIELGFFRPGEPVELLGRRLFVAEPQGSGHFAAVRAAEEALRAAFGRGWEVRGQGPLALDEDSEPDLAVVPGTFRVDPRARGLPRSRAGPGRPLGWRYRTVTALARGASVSPLALPGRSHSHCRPTALSLVHSRG